MNSAALRKMISHVKVLSYLASVFAPRGAFGKDHPFSHLKPDKLRDIFRMLQRRPMLTLQVREVRQKLAQARMETLFHGVKRVESKHEGVAHNALEYNLEAARTSAHFDRPATMVNVVMGIERVAKNVAAMDALSIGPRSEIELFAMMAAGFHPERLKALDLFSYSPYVDIGDMHSMPYPDNSFDIVFLGWVLSYSRDQALVAREVLRVCRNHAIVVLAGDYSDDKKDHPEFRNETTHMQSCDQLLKLFKGRVGNVYFRHDPDPPDVWMVMTVFDVRKP